jgi:hypothetical protein
VVVALVVVLPEEAVVAAASLPSRWTFPWAVAVGVEAAVVEVDAMIA